MDTDFSKIHMKIKIKSLAAEARIIRVEEAKAKKARKTELLSSLAEHRRGKLRQAARESYLVYAFLRGVPYWVVEKPGSSKPNWDEVEKAIKRFRSFNNWTPLHEIDKLKNELKEWREAVPA